MPKWEYAVEIVPVVRPDKCADLTQLKAHLQSAGANGWELVSVTPFSELDTPEPGRDWSETMLVVAKRPVGG